MYVMLKSYKFIGSNDYTKWQNNIYIQIQNVGAFSEKKLTSLMKDQNLFTNIVDPVQATPQNQCTYIKVNGTM